MTRKLTQTQLVDRFIGRRLTLARSTLNLTVDDIAMRLGVAAQQVRDYESGTQRITTEELSALSAMYGLPMAYFFDGLETELARIQLWSKD